MRAKTIPRLHKAKPPACGRLKCGKWLDTVWVHCDTRSEQVICASDIFFMIDHDIRKHSMSCSCFLSARSSSQKTYPCKARGCPSLPLYLWAAGSGIKLEVDR